MVIALALGEDQKINPSRVQVQSLEDFFLLVGLNLQ